MKRVFTATCLAATFAVGLAAQSTGTAGTAGAATQDPQAGSQRSGGPTTVTGCLRAGDTAGTFMLTDVVMTGRPGAAGTAGGTGTTAGTTTGGTTAGTATGGTTAGTGTATGGAAAAGQGTANRSITLTADSTIDLKEHVGHKVEVTGTLAGARGRTADAATTGTATGGTTGTGTATGTGTTSTSGTGTGAATGTGQGQGAGRGQRNMTVTAVKMIAQSCS
jgi:hypothetical protein